MGLVHRPPLGCDPEGFLQMNCASFIVDGFNLYHSIVDIQRDLHICTKWLDIFSLCSSYLHFIGNNANLEYVFYFSALATHLNDPGVIQRHQNYMECLKATGINCELSRFKPKNINCPNCNHVIVRHEEKETDVAIAAKLFELLHCNMCDTVVLVTGDTDISPAVETCTNLFPLKNIIFAFPYKRKNKELAKLTHSFKISVQSYTKYQLPNPFPLPDGTTISKPPSW